MNPDSQQSNRAGEVLIEDRPALTGLSIYLGHTLVEGDIRPKKEVRYLNQCSGLMGQWMLISSSSYVAIRSPSAEC